MKIASRVRRTGSVGIVGMVLGAALVLGSTSGAPAAGPAWSAPADLSATGQTATEPQVALSADGTKATAVWTRSNGTNTIIQTASATIVGTTTSWSAVTDLSAAGQNATDPQIALTADGQTATAIWIRNNGSNRIIQSASATISGNTADWSGATDLSATGQNARMPYVALSATDTLATAVWVRFDGANEVVQSASATISGKAASWSGPTTLSAAGAFAQWPRVAVSANGTRASAVWYRDNGSYWVVQSVSATISSNTADWSGATTLSAPDHAAFFQEIGLSADGTLATALWGLDTGGSNYVVQSASATISGKTASWSAATTISAAGASDPHLALSADGATAVAVWKRGNIETASAAISGASATWSSVTVLPDSSTTDQPRVALSADGTSATATWRIIVTGGGLVRSASAAVDGTSTTWSTAADVSVAGLNANTPRVATSADGAIAIAIWVRYNGANNIAQSATRTIPPRCLVAPTSPLVSAGLDRASLSFTAVPSGCEADRFQVRCRPQSHENIQ